MTETAPVILTDEQAVSLAWFLARQQIEDAEWLDWGNVPELAESSFEKLEEAMGEVVRMMKSFQAQIDESLKVNSRALWDRVG